MERLFPLIPFSEKLLLAIPIERGEGEGDDGVALITDKAVYVYSNVDSPSLYVSRLKKNY